MPIIDFLDQHMTRPEFTCRVHWTEGQIVMWDNRFTLHSSEANVHRSDQ
jgi:taurine dioxygenase